METMLITIKLNKFCLNVLMTIDVDRMTVRETDWIGPGGLDGIIF